MDTVIFTDRSQDPKALWISNGTPERTFGLPSELAMSGLSPVGSTLFLTRRTANIDHWDSPFEPPQLWKLDPISPEGTFLQILDSEGQGILEPSDVIVFGNQAFFSGNHPSGGFELYSFQVGITVDPVVEVSPNSALVTGQIDADENLTSATLEYGTTPLLGSSIPIAVPNTGVSGWTSYSVELPELLSSSTYYYRVKGSNEFSRFTSTTQSFTTPNAPPVFEGWTLDTTQEVPTSISVSTLLTNASDPENDPIGLTLASSRSLQGGRIVVADGQLTYTPPLGFFGSDRFPISLIDELGASAPFAILVSVQGPPGSTSQSGSPITITRSPSGTSTIQFSGLPGEDYNIQRSQDLETWTTITTLTTNEEGLIQYEEPSPLQSPVFYRVTN